jgi:hypothetical protein
MNSTDIIYSIGHLFQWSFGFFEVVGNVFNTILILLGFAGFFYWMNTQRKFNEKANVPVDIKDNTGWYNDSSKKQLK